MMKTMLLHMQTPGIKINQSNQYDVPFVKSALNFTVLAQKLLSKKLLLLITIFIIMTLHFVV
jgi:hypothetical protein